VQKIAVTAATPPPLPPPPAMDGWDPPIWWLSRMADPAVGLAEKMTWFWHAHLCTSQDKVNNWQMMWNQHRLLRTNALGSFRTLLQQLTVDPAMLISLDGDPSVVGAPNENYSREVMELFALGPGNYTETDVRNGGAKALAGPPVAAQQPHRRARRRARRIPAGARQPRPHPERAGRDHERIRPSRRPERERPRPRHRHRGDARRRDPPRCVRGSARTGPRSTPTTT
jgi:hypothetical protein